MEGHGRHESPAPKAHRAAAGSEALEHAPVDGSVYTSRLQTDVMNRPDVRVVDIISGGELTSLTDAATQFVAEHWGVSLVLSVHRPGQVSVSLPASSASGTYPHSYAPHSANEDGNWTCSILMSREIRTETGGSPPIRIRVELLNRVAVTRVKLEPPLHVSAYVGIGAGLIRVQ